MKKTFSKFTEAELAYRDLDDLTAEDVIEDIFQTSLNLATRRKDGEADFDELQNGINRIRSFVFTEKYHLEKAISRATKAAYLATPLKYDAKYFKLFDASFYMKDWIIEQPFNTRLNKLKKSDHESFLYWYKIYEMSKS
jgi:hypothetical protein